MKLTTLEKQLIALAAHGIWIEHHNGHRYIRCKETYNCFHFGVLLRKHEISVNNKIYGGVTEAIAVVDEVFKKIGRSTLEQWFDENIESEEVFSQSKVGVESRIDYDQPEGGLN